MPGKGTGLAARRRRRRRRWVIAFAILLLFMLAAAVYGLQQNAVRISEVKIFGSGQSLSTAVLAEMQGKYFGIVPRNSIFFFPASKIRANLLKENIDLVAVSIFRNGLTGLSIKVDYRVPIARWCGSTPDITRLNLVSDCYLFDTKGFIFGTTSAMSPINSFFVYESVPQADSPIGLTLPNAEKLPAAFNFARQLQSFGSPVSSIVFRADEVDDYIASGTRVTYLLGDEQNAFTALISARDDLNLSDGSIQYVDLRFNGKVYLKKKE